MNTHLETPTNLLIDHAYLVGRDLQKGLEGTNFYIDNVRKSEWPKESGAKLPFYVQVAPDDPKQQAKNLETRETYSLTHAAINSPGICLAGLRTSDDIVKELKIIERILLENLKWIWSQSLQKEVILDTRKHVVVRQGHMPAVPQGCRVAVVQFPRKVNFRGKAVHPYIGKKKRLTWCVNPKYKHAAEQVVYFHPETVEFQFPDLHAWSGKCVFRNIPDAEFNPHGENGFFRILLAYAAKPMKPFEGVVVTVLPRGVKGFLWYWAWKLIGINP
jgi:hypothetical protein